MAMQLPVMKFIIVSLLCISSISWMERKPKILIIGDSISLGYTPFVEKRLSGKAIVFHNPGNAQHTGTGLEHIEEWIGNGDWDIVQFNWGLWDLCYRIPVNLKDTAKRDDRDKRNGKVTFDVTDYASHLDTIIATIRKKTKAKLIFVTTTYVPENEPGRYVEDAVKYNEAAKEVMARHGVIVNDIYENSRLIHQKWALAPDNVHYQQEGYKALGALVSGFLEQEIKKQER